MNRVLEALERLAIQDNEEYKDATSVLELIKRDKWIIKQAFSELQEENEDLRGIIEQLSELEGVSVTKLNRIREIVEDIKTYNIYPYKHITSDIIQNYMKQIKEVLDNE